MFSPADISVIIPAYNIKERLLRLLSSLENQKPDPHVFETIVVDDGSNDSTAEFLKLYSGPLDLHPIIHEGNRGRSAARNSGIAAASRSLLLFLDADVIAPENLISIHASLHRDESSAFVGGVRYDKAFGANGFTKYLETRGLLKFKQTSPIPPRYFLSGHSSVPKDVAVKIQGFDELITYGEDIDFGIRLAEYGLTIYGVPEISVVHQHVRSIKEYAAVTAEFGFSTLPLLLNRYPPLKKSLIIDLIENSTLTGFFLRVLFLKPIFSFILKVSELFSETRLPTAVYNYILFRSYACGYLRNRR